MTTTAFYRGDYYVVAVRPATGEMIYKPERQAGGAWLSVKATLADPNVRPAFKEALLDACV